MYILSKKLDILFLSFFGIITWSLLSLFQYLDYFVVFYSLILFIMVIDFQHYYSMIPRLYLEYPILKKILIPLVLFVFLFLFFYQFFKLPYLWNMFLYLTFLHLILQERGIINTYLGMNKSQNKMFPFIMTTLSFLPLLSYHFNPSSKGFVFTSSENLLFTYPNISLFFIVLSINIIFLLLWLFYELYNFMNKKEFHFNRFIFMFSIILLYHIIFYFSSNTGVMLMALLANHGMQYILMNHKILTSFHKLNKLKSILLLFSFPFLLGAIEVYFKEFIDPEYSLYYTDNISAYLIVSAFWVLPTVHFLLDSQVWKKKHFNKIIENKKRQG